MDDTWKCSPLILQNQIEGGYAPSLRCGTVPLVESTRNGAITANMKNGVIMTRYSQHPGFLPANYLIDDKYKFAKDNDEPIRLQDDEADDGTCDAKEGCARRGNNEDCVVIVTENGGKNNNRAKKRVQIMVTEAGRKSGFGLAHLSRLELGLTLCSAALSLACLLLIGILVFRQKRMEPKICLTEECVKTAASLLAAVDWSVDPCDDFFEFACGAWNKRHMIPEDRSSINTFEVLADDLQILLKGLLEEPFNEEDNNATLKAKLFYQSCINTSQIQLLGNAPLKRVFDELGGYPVTEATWDAPAWSVERLLGMLRGGFNQGVIIEQWVGPDDQNSTTNIIQFDQMSLGLPSRDYYLKETSRKELSAYHRLMIDISVLLGAGEKQAKDDMDQVLQLEMRLANVSIPEADRHDTGEIYKKLSIEELQAEVPEFNWLAYLNSFLPIDVNLTESVVTYALPYLKDMGRILAETDRRVVHNYAVWRLLLDFLPHLGDEFQTHWAEFRRVLWGVSADRIRWNQCVELVNKRVGMAVGALFIRDNFNQQSKFAALEMIHNIREAFNELLEDNTWMDDETRSVARDKANAINQRIGYPDLLTNPIELSREYDALNITLDYFIDNIISCLKYDAHKNLMKLRQPVNKDKWTTEPAVVNAFYNPNKNDIVFPAGILQPLFYSHHFPKSLNYGGIGVVIGHEITHGFDDKGRQFDKNGNLKQWWNNATIQAFRQRTKCIIEQYNNYTLPEVGLNVNGRMTQGENIADNGGLKQAFRAYKKWSEINGPEPLLPGIKLTHEQLFFLNYAQIWCGSMRPEDALNKIRSSVHSPAPIRVLGPLSNSYDFSFAYSCPLGSTMNPAHKCSVW